MSRGTSAKETVGDVPRSRWTLPQWLAIGAGLVGFLGLSGWLLDIPTLRSVVAGDVAMKVNTAISLMLTGISLCVIEGRTPRAAMLAAQSAALLVAAIGFVTLCEYLFEWRPNIDELLMRDPGSAFAQIPGRMSPFSAVSFVVMGIAVAASPRPSLQSVVLLCAYLIGVIGSISLLGYFWNATEITSDQWLPPVAINSTLAFLAIAASLFLANRKDTSRKSESLSGKVENKVLLGFVAALALLFLGGGITYRMGVNVSQSAESINQTQQLRAALRDLYVSVTDAKSAQRNYVLTGQNRAEYETIAREGIASHIATVRRLMRDEPARLAQLGELTALIAARMQVLAKEVEIHDRLGTEAARAAITGDNNLVAMKGIRALVYRMDRGEEAALSQRSEQFARRRSLTLAAMLVTLGVATATLVLLFGSIAGDMRERARIMTALRQAEEDARRATHTKSEFLATMSHEIRTPMNGVIGMLEVLQQSSLMNEQQEMVGLIRESADSLLTIINEILDFSKIEAGRLDIEALPVAVGEVVEKTCSLLNRLAERKGSRLLVFADPAIPEMVLGDAARLRQILINLTNNAIKFSSGLSRPGQVWVRAALAARHPGHVIVEFQVTDNGIGMDETTVATLFTSFTQADASTTRRYGGSGLGLAISKQLVNLMGGDIRVATTVDRGSTFTVRLPFTLPAEHCDDARPSSEVRGLPCVVIGDDAGISADVATYLRADGAEVARYTDLAAAKDWIGSRSGLRVCIVDAGDRAATLSELREMVRSDSSRSLRGVLISRGERRNPRAGAEGIVMIDGNALAHQTCTEAVAVAAGRKSAHPEDRINNTRTVTRPALSREEALRQGRLILVAEDNPINQIVIQEQLNLLGYAADVAQDGPEAFQRWQCEEYDLLFTDLHMPKLDGYDLTMAIRTAEKGRSRMPIIALTANALPGEAERCRAVGMDDYLSKPASLAALARTLERWLPEIAGAESDSRAAAGSKAAVASPVGLTEGSPVDRSALEALVGSDPDVIQEVLRDFSVSAARLAAELAAACSHGDATTAGELGHRLKSSARAVGAVRLGELCASIEEAASANRVAALAALSPRFDAEMAAVQTYLRGLPDAQSACA